MTMKFVALTLIVLCLMACSESKPTPTLVPPNDWGDTRTRIHEGFMILLLEIPPSENRNHWVNKRRDGTTDEAKVRLNSIAWCSIKHRHTPGDDLASMIQTYAEIQETIISSDQMHGALYSTHNEEGTERLWWSYVEQIMGCTE